MHELLNQLELNGCDARIRFGQGEDELPVVDIPYTEDEKTMQFSRPGDAHGK